MNNHISHKASFGALRLCQLSVSSKGGKSSTKLISTAILSPWPVDTPTHISYTYIYTLKFGFDL